MFICYFQRGVTVSTAQRPDLGSVIPGEGCPVSLLIVVQHFDRAKAECLKCTACVYKCSVLSFVHSVSSLVRRRMFALVLINGLCFQSVASVSEFLQLFERL